MPKAVPGYLVLSCFYITVGYPVATTNPKAGLFLDRIALFRLLSFNLMLFYNMTYITQHASSV